MFDYSDVYSGESQNSISREFTRLKDLCYLDHAGTTLYTDSQIKSYSQDLCENVYGNPHSLSTSSRYATDVVDQVRYRVLKHLNTDPNNYSIVFTSGATGALKIVAECFDWSGEHSSLKLENDNVNQQNTVAPGSQYDGTRGTFTYLQDNHTSVLGIREVARDRGAAINCLSNDSIFKILSGNKNNSDKSNVNLSGNSLFAYPAQCNFSGVKYPLSWVAKVQDGILDEVSFKQGDSNKKNKCSKWFCLLDAASFVATSLLDLSCIQPDFVCLSFYKIFGYPTGLGALLVKNSSAHVLRKTYFGGGTVLISLSSERFHVPRPILHDKFEDGTIPFLSIVSLRHGFDALSRLTGNMSNVSRHTFSLGRYVHHHLIALHHANGSPVAVVYADTDYEDVETQGGIVNFNLLRANGEHVGFVEILNVANLYNIQLRTGCFCNPGACQRHLELSIEELRSHFQAGHVCGDEKDLINGRPTGSVRVSFGFPSTKADADKLLHMIQACFVDGKPLTRIPHWWNAFREKYKQKFNDGILESVTSNLNHVKMNGRAGADEICDVREGEVLVSCEMRKTLRAGDERGVRLERIFLYPVKSCGGFSVESWTIGRRGLDYDREWMIVTPSGVSLTQKQDTRMCLIRPTIQLETRQLLLDFPGLPTIRLPLRHVATLPNAESSLCQSKVCGDRIQGWDCGDDVASWLSNALNRDGLRLMRHWTNDQRVTKRRSNVATITDDQQATLSLSNQAQFLLVNASSIEWLKDRMDPDTDCNVDDLLLRFRSNLVVGGAEAFAEGQWQAIRIGNNQFQSEGPCTRCQMICIDQSTGEKTREPLKTLAAAFQGKMRFGAYLSHVATEGVRKISVGDEVKPFTADVE